MESFCQTENAQLMVKCKTFFASYLTDGIAIECLAGTRAKRWIDVPTNQSVINRQSIVQVEHVVIIHNSKQSPQVINLIKLWGQSGYGANFFLPIGLPDLHAPCLTFEKYLVWGQLLSDFCMLLLW